MRSLWWPLNQCHHHLLVAAARPPHHRRQQESRPGNNGAACRPAMPLWGLCMGHLVTVLALYPLGPAAVQSATPGTLCQVPRHALWAANSVRPHAYLIPATPLRLHLMVRLGTALVLYPLGPAAVQSATPGTLCQVPRHALRANSVRPHACLIPATPLRLHLMVPLAGTALAICSLAQRACLDVAPGTLCQVLQHAMQGS
jgi:hypothetical protein